MRLKEIETRLAEIKEELNTRAAELTDEEITKLETEVTDLQEERTALLTAAEKRKKLLERIAAGEPTGGAGADTTLLRNFKGCLKIDFFKCFFFVTTKFCFSRIYIYYS